MIIKKTETKKCVSFKKLKHTIRTCKYKISAMTLSILITISTIAMPVLCVSAYEQNPLSSDNNLIDNDNESVEVEIPDRIQFILKHTDTEISVKSTPDETVCPKLQTIPETTTPVIVEEPVITTTELKECVDPDCEDEQEDQVTDVEINDDTREEYIVYKPSTYYVHRSTCHWVNDSCYEISSTEDIEARLCDECYPDIEIINEYVEPTPVVSYDNINDDGEFAALDCTDSGLTSLRYVSDVERIMLAKLVWGEAGSDWLSIYDKACVVAVAYDRYCDGGWQDEGAPNSVYNVIIASGQFDGYHADNPTPPSCIEAVEYYFENMEIFPHYLKFNGDGTYNYFS